MCAAKKDEKKADKGKDLSPEEKLKLVMQKINKDYGKNTVLVADDMSSVDVPRIETGIFSLDLAMGGGIPRGRVTMFFGLKSSGKTTNSLRAVAKAQRKCALCNQVAIWDIQETVDEKTGEVKVTRSGKCLSCKDKFRPMKCVWVDAEGAFDIRWARVLGVWTDELHLMRPETAEQTVDVVDAILRTQACDLMVLDSIAALVPIDEIEQSSEKWQQGLQPRLVNKMCRKINSALNETGRTMYTAPTVILLNQVRMKIGVMFGNPETRPGGMMQEFITSVEIRSWSGKVILDGTEDDEKNGVMREPLYQIQNFKVVKNKTSRPGMEGEYTVALVDTEFHKKGEVVEEETVFGMGLKYGLLKNDPEKATKFLFNGESLQKSQIVKMWMENRPLFEQTKQAVSKVFLAV
jgi:recombination protein RecA